MISRNSTIWHDLGYHVRSLWLAINFMGTLGKPIVIIHSLPDNIATIDRYINIDKKMIIYGVITLPLRDS